MLYTGKYRIGDGGDEEKSLSNAVSADCRVLFLE